MDEAVSKWPPPPYKRSFSTNTIVAGDGSTAGGDAGAAIRHEPGFSPMDKATSRPYCFAMHHADPQSLRLFIAVCECGTIARAAEREFIAPSALSKRIADLEESLGVALLTRSQRGVSPTPAGEALLEHARPILQSLQRLQAEVGEHADGIRGHVRVLSIRSAMIGRLSDDLACFLAAHPKVGLTLEERVSDEVTRGVVSGSAEIGICRDVLSSRELKSHPYGQDTLVVVAGRSHPLASRERLDFIDTLDYDHICVGQGNSHQKFSDRVAREVGRSVNYRFYVSSPNAALRFISEGLGVGIFPSEAIARFADMYQLSLIPLSNDWARRTQYICTSALEPLSPAARQLLNYLLERRHHEALARIAA